jgi:hypothetical protein
MDMLSRPFSCGISELMVPVFFVFFCGSSAYKSISSMAMCDMMIVTGILGVTIRFFEPDQQKIVLWCQVGALLVSQAMLAGEPGDMIEAEQKQAGGIGTFISIVAATIGAL